MTKARVNWALKHVIGRWPIKDDLYSLTGQHLTRPPRPQFQEEKERYSTSTVLCST